MSDTRFIILGIGLIFAGFSVLALFGSQYIDATIEAEQFGKCFNYFEDREPVPVDCDVKLQAKSLFFVLAASLVGAGVISLIKGVKGKWDQSVKPQDMLGPGGPPPGSKGDNPSDTEPKRKD